MLKENLVNVPGTKIYLAGSKNFNLTEPANVDILKEMNIRKVFMIFNSGGDMVRTVRGNSETQQEFFAEMARKGVQISPLLRDPHNLRAFDSFHREVGNTRGAIVIECFHGKRASAAYAMYHILKTKPWSLEEIRNRFMQAGLTKKDLATVELYLRHSGINIKQELARRSNMRRFKKALRSIGMKRVERRK